MKRIINFLSISIILIVGVISANGFVWQIANYSETAPDGSVRDVQISYPSDFNTIRGLMINYNASSGDTRGEYIRKWVANWLRLPEHQFAFVGTRGFEHSPQSQYTTPVMLNALASFAATTGHPEITNAPWAMYAFSAGASRSWEATSTNADIVISWNGSSGGFGFALSGPVSLITPSNALSVPALMLASKSDAGTITNSNYQVTSTNVPRGWLADFSLIQQGTSHAETWNQHAPGMAWLKSVIKYSYPTNQCVLNGKLTLNRMQKSDGWLSQPSFQGSTFPLITNYAAYPFDKTNNAWWLPDKDMAYVYRAYASWNNQLAITAPATEIEVAPGGNIAVTIDDSLFLGWTNLALFNFSTNLMNKTSGAASFTITNIQSGMYVIHVIGTKGGTNAISQPVLFFANVTAAPPVLPCTTSHQWYAATNGLPGNTGAINSPWDLQTALSKVNSVVPGDIIWIRQGNYTHTPQGVSPGNEGYIFRVEISGTPSSQIIIQSYPGERASIDGGAWGGQYAFHATARPTLSIGSSIGNSTSGQYVTWINTEIYSSSTETRLSFEPDATGNFPTDIFRSDGVYIFGTGSKIVNCIVHDLSTGISAWKQSTLTECYGNVVYNNGWQGTPHLHGHNFYTQHNFTGTQPITIKRNIAVSPYDKNIQMYGSSDIEVARYRTSENAWIGNYNAGHGGVLVGTRNGGLADRARDDQVFNNYGYGAAFTIYFQPDPAAYLDVIVTGNYFVNTLFGVSSWKQATITNNIFTIVPGLGKIVSLVTNATTGFIPWNSDRNTFYYSPTNAAVFDWEGPGNFSLAAWRGLTHYESNSIAYAALPTTNLVIVQDNAYNANRAQVIVYNWATNNFVAANAAALGFGTNVSIVIHNAQDYYNDAISSTTTSTNTILLNMQASAHTAAVPFGEASNQPLTPVTFPLFGAFIIEKTGSSPPPPPVATFTSVVSSFNPDSGVLISFSPSDIGGLGNGATTFSRTNTTNIIITITAPATTPASDFQEWDRNGAFFSNSPSVSYTNSSSTSWMAVYATTKRTLTVNSAAPASGVTIQMSPADTGGQSNGNTPFQRTIFTGTITTLTAPLSASNGNVFSRWNRNGILYTTSMSAMFTNNSDLTFEAVFVPPITPFSGISPYSALRRGVRY